MYSVPESLQAVHELSQSLRRQRHRALMLVSGDAVTVQQYAERLIATLEPQRVEWFGDTAPARFEGRSLQSADQLLGTEVDLVVIDVRCGFDPDAFGLLSGVVRAGGLLVLLGPDLAAWPHIDDPQRQRITVYPLSRDQLSNRFLRRLVNGLQQESRLIEVSLDASGAVSRLRLPEPVLQAGAETLDCEAPESGAFGLTTEQEAVVSDIARLGTRRTWRPLVLTADRGRGKSHALGVAAARLVREGYRVAFTGPHQNAVGVAREVCGQHLQAGESPRFLPADALLTMPVDSIDILLVDEAAALPLQILQRLTQSFSRVALVSTVHGYEGTGRSFGLRFFKWLDRNRSGWQHLSLNKPIRWAPGDPLETVVWKLLLLDAEVPAVAPDTAIVPDSLQLVELDRDQLWQDEARLRPLFALLVHAHYRTRPFDLWHLLDGPNLKVMGLFHDDTVIGIALLADEGPLQTDLLEQVFEGRRRVRGHFLPQSLVREIAVERLAGRRMLRIMRLAVHPECQRRGCGKYLLAAVEQYARSLSPQVSMLGVSYGASIELLNFWQQCGYSALQMGTSRQGTSGEYAVLMVRCLDRNLPLAIWRREFSQRLLDLLPDAFRDTDIGLILSLFPHLTADVMSMPGLSRLQSRQLRAFAWQQRGFEDTRSALICFGRIMLLSGRLGRAEAVARVLVVARLLQCRDWEDVTRLSGLSGRTEIIDKLRHLVQQFEDLIEASVDRNPIPTDAEITE